MNRVRGDWRTLASTVIGTLEFGGALSSIHRVNNPALLDRPQVEVMNAVHLHLNKVTSVSKPPSLVVLLPHDSAGWCDQVREKSKLRYTLSLILSMSCHNNSTPKRDTMSLMYFILRFRVPI